MKLYSSKSIESCDEYECLLHNKEIDNALKKLRTIENYRCAVIVEPLDEGNLHNRRIDESCLHELSDLLDGADCKNGCDLMTDNDGEFLVFMTYGQGYTYNGEYMQCVTSYKILPIKDDVFLNVVSYLDGDEVKDAQYQFEQEGYEL